MAAKVAALERFRDAQEEVEQELAAARKMVRVAPVRRVRVPRTATPDRRRLSRCVTLIQHTLTQPALFARSLAATLSTGERCAQRPRSQGGATPGITASHGLIEQRS